MSKSQIVEIARKSWSIKYIQQCLRAFFRQRSLIGVMVFSVTNEQFAIVCQTLTPNDVTHLRKTLKTLKMNYGH